jgi:hypothetical protein
LADLIDLVEDLRCVLDEQNTALLSAGEQNNVKIDRFVRFKHVKYFCLPKVTLELVAKLLPFTTMQMWQAEVSAIDIIMHTLVPLP